MKEFNIQKAREGYPVCTRDGRNARIIFWEAKGNFPIIALITLSDGSEDHVSYTIYGEFCEEKRDGLDLMMVTTKHEGWVNVYSDKGYHVDKEIWEFEENAIEIGKEFPDYVATVKIEWEE